MASRDDSDADALAVLELLADASPEKAVEELVSAAQSAGATAERLRRLNGAERLAGRVHARFRQVERRELGLKTLAESARELMLADDLGALLDVLTARTRQLLTVDLAFVALFDESGASAAVRSVDGNITSALPGLRMPDAAWLATDALPDSAPSWTSDCLADSKFNPGETTDAALRQEGVTTMLAIPLSRKHTIVGVLYAAHRTTRHLTVDEVSLANSLGELAMTMFDKLREQERIVADLALTEQFTARAERAMRELTELTNMQDRVMGRLLSGMDLSAFANEIARELPGALRIYTHDGRVVAWAGEMPAVYDDSAAIAEAWSSHEPRMLEEGGWAVPVFAGDEPLGTLLLHPEQPLNGYRRRQLSLMAQAAGVMMMVFDAKATVLTVQRNELLTDLISSDGRAARRLGNRAHNLGINLRQPHVVVVAREVDRDVQGFWAAQYSRRLGGLSATFEDTTVLILPGEDASQAAKMVHEDLVPMAGGEVTVAAAGPTRGLETVRDIYLEARRCLDAMAVLGATGSAGSARDMGFLGLLLSDERDMEGFVRSVLGPVIDYDSQRMTGLIPTLEAYYAVGGSPTYAARMLHVHRNTVERRLERITEILGPTWRQADRALEIQLALRIQRTRDALQQ
ncbi:helix-turn-helix domain-containing protein [Streptomyces sp. NPDC088387]|uniref:helix-turn-helix domain-containing protein n=1 Tax=Streptomyces sp. NPDC088387 TaxID=3365859 RepID=UPI00380286D8